MTSKRPRSTASTSNEERKQKVAAQLGGARDELRNSMTQLVINLHSTGRLPGIIIPQGQRLTIKSTEEIRAILKAQWVCEAPEKRDMSSNFSKKDLKGVVPNAGTVETLWDVLPNLEWNSKKSKYMSPSDQPHHPALPDSTLLLMDSPVNPQPEQASSPSSFNLHNQQQDHLKITPGEKECTPCILQTDDGDDVKIIHTILVLFRATPTVQQLRDHLSDLFRQTNHLITITAISGITSESRKQWNLSRQGQINQYFAAYICPQRKFECDPYLLVTGSVDVPNREGQAQTVRTSSSPSQTYIALPTYLQQTSPDRSTPQDTSQPPSRAPNESDLGVYIDDMLMHSSELLMASAPEQISKFASHICTNPHLLQWEPINHPGEQDEEERGIQQENEDKFYDQLASQILKNPGLLEWESVNQEGKQEQKNDVTVESKSELFEELPKIAEKKARRLFFEQEREKLRNHKSLFNFSRWSRPLTVFDKLILALYAPFGIVLVVLRFVLCFLIMLCGGFLPHNIARRVVSATIQCLLGIIINIKNKERFKNPAQIIVGNHITDYDASLLVMMINDIRQIISVKRIPIVGRLLAFAYSPWNNLWVPIDIQSDEELRRVVRNNSKSRTKEGRRAPIGIFPEGGSTNGKVGTMVFERFVFGLGLPVTPISIKHSCPLPINTNWLGAQWLSNILWLMFIPFHVYDVNVLPVMTIKEGEEDTSFAKRVQIAISKDIGLIPTTFVEDKLHRLDIARTAPKEEPRYGKRKTPSATDRKQIQLDDPHPKKASIKRQFAFPRTKPSSAS